MTERTIYWTFATCLMLLVFSPCAVSHAEPPTPSPTVSSGDNRELPECNGFVYRTKRADVPVFAEPDSATEVLTKLPLGERVCRVGVQADFSILTDVAGTGAERRLVFVKSTDLWSPNAPAPVVTSQEMPAFQRLKSFIEYVQSGGIPEDGLMPYRTIIGPFSPPEDSATPAQR